MNIQSYIPNQMTRWMYEVPLLTIGFLMSVFSTLQSDLVLAKEPQPQQVKVQQTDKSRAEPKSAQDYFRRAMRRYRSQDRAGAIADFDRAIQLQPNFPDAYNNRGIVKGSLGDKALAIADYSQAIALNPKFFEDRKSTRLNSSHRNTSRMPSSA